MPPQHHRVDRVASQWWPSSHPRGCGESSGTRKRTLGGDAENQMSSAKAGARECAQQHKKLEASHCIKGGGGGSSAFSRPPITNGSHLPNATPLGSYHRATKACTNIVLTKMAENHLHCINYTSACPTPPCNWVPKTLFWLKIERNQKDVIFDPKERGHTFGPCNPHPHPKKGFSGRVALGGSRPKTHWGCCYRTK